MHIRSLLPGDGALLEEMVYLSLWRPPGDAPFSRDIVTHPGVRQYIDAWGSRRGDIGVVAEDSDSRCVLGAAWARLLSVEGAGYWSEDTPELAIAVVPSARGCGIGTRLLQELIKRVATQHSALSLSVALGNPARRLYERLGFRAEETLDTSMIMVLEFPIDTGCTA
jgi:GNAT superfamily N-acetyltransferase